MSFALSKFKDAMKTAQKIGGNIHIQESSDRE
jgi:hypothetical protein